MEILKGILNYDVPHSIVEYFRISMGKNISKLDEDLLKSLLEDEAALRDSMAKVNYFDFTMFVKECKNKFGSGNKSGKVRMAAASASRKKSKTLGSAAAASLDESDEKEKKSRTKAKSWGWKTYDDCRLARMLGFHLFFPSFGKGASKLTDEQKMEHMTKVMDKLPWETPCFDWSICQTQRTYAAFHLKKEFKLTPKSDLEAKFEELSSKIKKLLKME